MQNVIRVLHTEWSNGWGGQEIRIINEMIAVRDEGVDVFLACRNDSSIKKKALENNIKVFTLPFRGNADVKTLFSLSKIIKAHSIDIVNTHSGKDTWVGGFAAKLVGIKFIRTRHISNKINPSKLNFINELADYIFTTGESIKADMIKYNRIKPHKIESIPTGIDVYKFDFNRYKRQKCREQFNINKNEIVIGIIAVLREFKRHDFFLKMAKSLIKKYPDKKLSFLIAGDGPQKSNIIDLIEKLNLVKNVNILGHVDQIPELLSAIDIFVLSSDSKEGVPQAVMQALFMGKNVVATNSGSTKDLFMDGNFQLVETNSVDELIKGVSFYLDQSIVKKNRALIDDKFSKKFMTSRILQEYISLLR